jgi:hypothetical protein
MDITVDAKNGERIYLMPGKEEIGVYTGSDNYCRVWVDKSNQPMRIFITPPYNEETVLRILQMVEYVEKAHHWKDCEVVRQMKFGRKPGVRIGFSTWDEFFEEDKKKAGKDAYLFKTDQDIKSSSLVIEEAGPLVSPGPEAALNVGPEDIATNIKVRRGWDENPYYLPVFNEPKADTSADANTYRDLAAILDSVPVPEAIKVQAGGVIDKKTIEQSFKNPETKPKTTLVKVRRVTRVRRIDLSIE